MFLKVLGLTLAIFMVSGVNCKVVKVQTPVGSIMGEEKKISNNGTINSIVQVFRGIPYAEAPVGNFRFRRPQPSANFQSTFDATKHGPVCFQHEGSNRSNFKRSEDCLRLNIYAPVTKVADPKPVMIWIHGGGFTHGDGNSFDGSMLAAVGDVIVVTVNYRLSYFGFFTTGDATAPGNYGLWDQHMAIKWVHKNIKAFGGNPDQITLFGGSAGGSSVMYQAFYPGNKGLVKRIIAQSGTITSPWADKPKSDLLDSSKLFADLSDCTRDEPSKYTECLQVHEAERLNKTINDDFDKIVGPVVDYQFILDEPANLLSGNTKAKAALDMFHSVDLLIGYNNADGLLDLPKWLELSETGDSVENFTLYMDVFSYVLIPEYIYMYQKHENYSDVGRLITMYAYTDWLHMEENDKQKLQLIKLATDIIAAMPAAVTARAHSNRTSENRTTYAYEFAMPSPPSKFPMPDLLPAQLANHGDELPFIFGTDLKKTKADQKLKPQLNTCLGMMTAWTNFAKTGNPNLPNNIKTYFSTPWPEFASPMDYLRITPKMSTKSAKTGLKEKTLFLWEKQLPAINKFYIDEYYDDY